MAAHQARALLMGGRACVFYGAAQFSRDTDLLIPEPKTFNTETKRSISVSFVGFCSKISNKICHCP